MKRIRKWEIVAIATLTMLFFFFSSLNLGSFEIPSSCWQPPNKNSEIVLDFNDVKQIKEVYLFLADENRTKFEVYGGKDRRILFSYDNKDKVHFYSWDKISLKNESTDFLKFVFDEESEGKIGEIVVISAENKKIDVIGVDGTKGARKLIDEQDIVKIPITSQEGAYFDEMYFVRTAWEYLNLNEPYETTHPPLGKLIIATGILCFGMNPFGWRILGILAAAVMIAIMFLFARKMFRSGATGFFAAFLLTFDFMHFSLARLATGEIYILLFSLLMFYFAFDYFFKMENGEKEKGKKSLLLSVIFFGLCFSVKWIAVFSFFSIFILLLISNLKRGESIFNDCEIILAGLFLSAAIYIAMYIPYMFSGGGHGVSDVFWKQLNMFGYHAFLEATHPFSSPWWSWQLMLKPLWMYFNSFDGNVSTIVLMGNPAIWWGSIPALISIAVMVIKDIIKKEEQNFIPLFILIPFLLLWLPYALIPRILFIYHFAPNLIFMIFALSYWLSPPSKPFFYEKKKWCFIFAFLFLTALLFFLFYPVISGYPVAYEYKENLRWLEGWIF